MVRSKNPHLHSNLFYKVVMTTFGISGGLSFFVIAIVLMFRLSRVGLPSYVIGLFALAGIPYNIRFLWPFLIDHVRLPYLSARFGQRKSWGVLAQILSSVGFVLLGLESPEHHLVLTFCIALFTAFFAAIQDIISDAYRFDFTYNIALTDSVPLQTIGFRCGQCLAASFIPMLANFFGWLIAHIMVVGIKIFSIILICHLNEPEGRHIDDENKNKKKQVFAQISHVAKRTIYKPFLTVFLISIVLLRCIDTVAGPVQTMFIGTLGVSNIQFGIIKSGIGFCATMTGILMAGYCMKKIPLFNVMIVGVLFQSCASLLSLLLLKTVCMPFTLGWITVFQDLFQGFMNTLMIVYISSFCERELNIYHFTLFSAISSLSRTLFTSLFGITLSSLGWSTIFFIPLFMSIPLIMLLMYLKKNKVTLTYVEAVERER